jgi:hypothetical protein
MAAFFNNMLQQFNPGILQPQAQPTATPRSHVKMRDPDPYDGNDPTKLCSFISQCKLVFRTRPEEYRSDHLRIMYAVSWLKGTAQHWFEPNLALADHQLPAHAQFWDDFENALTATFGEPDPIASATNKLDNLVMKDYHHLNKFNIEFNEYSTITGFSKHDLYTCYYKGLAPCIKDALVFSGRPNTLAALREHAQQLDMRYWECKDEEKAHASPSKVTGSSSSKSSTTSAATTSSSAKTSSASKNPSRLSTPSSSSSLKKPDLTKILGPDGKLLPEEKERRKKNDLCMICGSKNHFADKCDHQKETTKAHANELETVIEDDAQSDNGSNPAEAESSDTPN